MKFGKKTGIIFSGILIAFLLLFGCAQPENGNSQNSDLDNPYVQPLTQPEISLNGFEFKYSSLGKASALTLLFQKNNLTTIKKTPDNVLELGSQPISESELKDLAQVVQASQFFDLPQEEYGEFVATNGPTIVLEGKMNGQEKLVSCQQDCPAEIKNITDKVEQFIESD